MEDVEVSQGGNEVCVKVVGVEALLLLLAVEDGFKDGLIDGILAEGGVVLNVVSEEMRAKEIGSWGFLESSDADSAGVVVALIEQVLEDLPMGH